MPVHASLPTPNGRSMHRVASPPGVMFNAHANRAIAFALRDDGQMEAPAVAAGASSDVRRLLSRPELVPVDPLSDLLAEPRALDVRAAEMQADEHSTVDRVVDHVREPVVVADRRRG
jgi:hypothetical protein